MEGFRLPFDADRPLLLSQQPEVYDAFPVTGYEKTYNGFNVFFDQGIVLAFAHNAEAEQFTIQPTIPDQLGAYRAMVLPFESVSGSVLTPTQNYPGINVEFKGRRFVLSLPPRSIVRTEEKQLVVSTEALFQEIRYSLRTGESEGIFDLWFQDLVADISPAEYGDALQSFVNTAYLGWRSTRFDPAERVWSHLNGGSQFDEDIMIALLAEAWKRNEYARVFTDMRLTADTHRSSLTYRSAVFLGNLRQMTAGLEQTERPSVTAISNLVNQGSLDVFSQPELFSTVANHGDETLVRNLLSLVNSIGPSALTGGQALGALLNLYVYPVPLPGLLASRSSYFPLIETEILPNIVRLDEGFFYQAGSEVVDSLESLQVGKLLEAAGREEGDERLANLGRHLVTSVLALADTNGFIPDRFNFAAGAITAFNRHRGPEDFYRFLETNSYYPEKTSLYSYFGAGSFVYTLATITNASLESSRFILSLENTPSRTHYFIFKGIPPIDPFSGMELFNIIYRDAADFEIYSRGRYYNPAARILMIKYFDDNPTPRIVIYQ